MPARSNDNIGHRIVRSVPPWAWPLWAFGALVGVSMVSMLFFTSDAGSRIVVANDTTVRLHVFECFDDPCTKGISDDDATLDPGTTSPVLWRSPAGTGLVGVATSPGNRLVGCLKPRHAGKVVLGTHAVPASWAKPCPGQKPDSMPVTVMVNP